MNCPQCFSKLNPSQQQMVTCKYCNYQFQNEAAMFQQEEEANVGKRVRKSATLSGKRSQARLNREQNKKPRTRQVPKLFLHDLFLMEYFDQYQALAKRHYLTHTCKYLNQMQAEFMNILKAKKFRLLRFAGVNFRRFPHLFYKSMLYFAAMCGRERTMIDHFDAILMFNSLSALPKQRIGNTLFEFGILLQINVIAQYKRLTINSKGQLNCELRSGKSQLGKFQLYQFISYADEREQDISKLQLLFQEKSAPIAENQKHFAIKEGVLSRRRELQSLMTRAEQLQEKKMRKVDLSYFGLCMKFGTVLGGNLYLEFRDVLESQLV